VTGMHGENPPAASKLKPLGLGMLVGLLVGVLSQALIHLEKSREQEVARSRLQIEASAMRARLESELNSTFSIGLSAAALVSAKPDFSFRDYERLAQSLSAVHPSLRNIALAPDNVITYVYPLAGNEVLLGLNLEQVQNQREGVLRMRRDWRPFIAGPLKLVHGGVGFVHRVPVIVLGAGDRAYYWGQVSVALDAVPTFAKVGLNSDHEIAYALRGRDGGGREGGIFFGAAETFADPAAIKMDVVIPGGSWQLAAQWRESGEMLVWREISWHAFVLLLALGSGGLVAFAVRSQERLQVLASHDSLTGLANRHQFLVQAESFLAFAARQKYPFSVLNMDLEGFKSINDDYGHEVGDAMLVHVAAQAKECLRTSDFIARFGGDEFLVLLPDTRPGPVLDQLIARLREAVSLPLMVRGHMLSVTISVGVASYPDDGVSLIELMRVSDVNMYADKRLRKKQGVQD
jgi:diguanylate cyclase